MSVPINTTDGIPCGGPAFPSQAFTKDEPNDGMSLRDWFAGMALQGLATNHDRLLSDSSLIADFGTAGVDMLQAKIAYRLADAMLAERAKR